MGYPDYNNSLVGLPNAILKHFGVTDGRPRRTLPLMDRALEQDFETVIVLLLDGMGTQAVKDHLAPTGFFARHMTGSFSSVFPSTTVAATTSAFSGLEPAAHSWLGWDCYYPQIDKNVTVFLNTESGTAVPAADFPVAMTFCPYTPVTALLRAQGCQAWDVTPLAPDYPQSFGEVLEKIGSHCRRPGKKAIFGYWNQPDSTMHATGCRSRQTGEVLRNLEAQVEAFAATLQDTLLIVTADHGLMDAKNVTLEDYPAIAGCLCRAPSIEPRAVNFFVKPGMEETFCQAFTEAFAGEFLLLPKEQAKALFGGGPEHPCFDGMVGDFLAAAVGDTALYNTRQEKENTVGTHAGLTKGEMEIPFIEIPIK